MQDTVSKRVRYSDLFIVEVGKFVYPVDSFHIKGTNLDMDILYRHQTLNELRKGLMENDDIHVLRENVKDFKEGDIKKKGDIKKEGDW